MPLSFEEPVINFECFEDENTKNNRKYYRINLTNNFVKNT